MTFRKAAYITDLRRRGAYSAARSTSTPWRMCATQDAIRALSDAQGHRRVDGGDDPALLPPAPRMSSATTTWPSTAGCAWSTTTAPIDRPLFRNSRRRFQPLLQRGELVPLGGRRRRAPRAEGPCAEKSSRREKKQREIRGDLTAAGPFGGWGYAVHLALPVAAGAASRSPCDGEDAHRALVRRAEAFWPPACPSSVDGGRSIAAVCRVRGTMAGRVFFRAANAGPSTPPLALHGSAPFPQGGMGYYVTANTLRCARPPTGEIAAETAHQQDGARLRCPPRRWAARWGAIPSR